MPMINEAIFALFEGVATVEAIDTVMKLGMNHPMGPLELADFIGLDTCLAIMDVLHDGFGDPKYRAVPAAQQYVAAGWLGQEAAAGFTLRHERTARRPVRRRVAMIDRPSLDATSSARSASSRARSRNARSRRTSRAWDREHTFPRELYTKLNDAA